MADLVSAWKANTSNNYRKDRMPDLTSDSKPNTSNTCAMTELREAT